MNTISTDPVPVYRNRKIFLPFFLEHKHFFGAQTCEAGLSDFSVSEWSRFCEKGHVGITCLKFGAAPHGGDPCNLDARKMSESW